MKIDELEAGQKVGVLVGVITHLDEVIETSNGVQVQDGIIEDDSGQVKLSMWKEYAGMFSVGDKVSISNGFCKEFKNELQVSTGFHGKINKIPNEKVE